MRPCSVAILVNFVPPYRVALFKALEREVRRLTILVSTGMEADRPWQPSWRGLDVRVLRSLTIPYRRYHPDGFYEDLSIHLSPGLLPKLLALAPDIVIAGEFGARTLLACLYRRFAVLLGRRTRLLVWATVSDRTERGRGRLRSLLRRLIARMADGVVTNGESGARYLKTIGFREERIFRIHQSTDLERFEDIRYAPGDTQTDKTIRLVTVGSLIERKGLLPFLAGLSAWCERNPERKLHWRLIGEGPVRRELEAAELPDNLTIEMTGNRDYDDVPALMTGHHMLAFPTLADEWGLVVNEGMAAGLPVLASRNAQAAEEMVRDGENGWLFDPADEADTDRVLDLALGSSSAELKRMSDDARKTAGDFSHDNTLRRLLHAIETVQAA